MAEETEDGDEELKGGRSPSSPLPPNPSLHPNLKRKPRDPHLPGLSNCHSCGLHFPPQSQTDKLQILDSQWRVVLLCESCIAAVHSAQSCSYCFSKITTSDPDRLLACRLCPRRVHPRCAAAQILPDPFTCIDCCPYIVSHRRNRVAAASTSSLEGLVKDADATKKKKAAKEKEKAAKKASVAKDAAKHASSAPDAVAVAVAKVPAPPKDLDDEELAIQLHLAMNGSRRILRSRSADVNCSSGSKKTQLGSSVSKSQSGDFSNCEKVEVSTEEKCFIEMQNSSIHLDSSKEDHDKGTDLGVVHMDAEKGDCNRISWIEGEANENTDGKNVSDDLEKEPVKQELESCDQSSTIEFPNENADHMNGDDDGCDKSMLVDVPVKEELWSCDESSSSELDDDEMGINGLNNANLVDIPVVEQHAVNNLSSSVSFNSNREKDLTEGVDGIFESNLINVPVKQVVGFCNQSSSSEMDSDEEAMHGYNESNLVDIPVKSCPTMVVSTTASH